METLQARLQRETREKVYNLVKEVHIQKPFEDVTGEPHYVTNEIMKIISHTISETIKAGVSVIEGEKKEDYCYDEKNEAHNDFEESLDYLETKGEAHEEGFNQALQTAVIKLQELSK